MKLILDPAIRPEVPCQVRNIPIRTRVHGQLVSSYSTRTVCINCFWTISEACYNRSFLENSWNSSTETGSAERLYVAGVSEIAGESYRLPTPPVRVAINWSEETEPTNSRISLNLFPMPYEKSGNQSAWSSHMQLAHAVSAWLRPSIITSWRDGPSILGKPYQKTGFTPHPRHGAFLGEVGLIEIPGHTPFVKVSLLRASDVCQSPDVQSNLEI